MQKAALFFVLIVFSSLVQAQNTTTTKKNKIKIMDDKSVIFKDIKKYLGKDASEAIIKQVGKDTYTKIIGQSSEKVLPGCVQDCIKNSCRFNKYMQYEAYEIADYLTEEFDAFANSSQVRYSIVAISPEDNKNIKDDCGVGQIFYVRMKSSDFQYDNSKTPLGRGDRIIFLLKNYMPAQAILDSYFAAKQKCVALTAANTNAEYCTCYNDLNKLGVEFNEVCKQLEIIMEEGEVQFRTTAIAADIQKYVNFLAGDLVQDRKAIEAALIKYNCK